jgi:hypothetical protein
MRAVVLKAASGQSLINAVSYACSMPEGTSTQRSLKPIS